MSVCDPKELANLYDWLETIPFSRLKKNFARDFSDGLLAAELIKHFFPSLVDIHNYPASSSVEQKKINWSVLNHKVLKKLDFPISDITINELASGSKRDATEYFLFTLREKIDLHLQKVIEKMKKKKDGSGDNLKGIGEEELKGPSKDLRLHDSFPDKAELSFSRNGTSGKRETKHPHIDDSNVDIVSRELYDQKVQELLALEETVHVLKARILRLESLIQLKNVTIERQQQVLEKLKSTVASNTDKT